MTANQKDRRKSAPALKVPQWLASWNEITWNKRAHRQRPQEFFYQFNIPASTLRSLSGISARSTANRSRGADDLGIQRRHDPRRSSEIAEYIKYGYPWSDMSKSKRSSGEFDDLKKPGWLPTAIVVNILTADDKRGGRSVGKNDMVTITNETSNTATVNFPNGYTDADWQSATIPPIEIIDGQHRLWAFDSQSEDDGFHIPVVAFVGLDISWQAYLFYTINIKPKKINASLAYDLYPLLRTEDWLERFDGHPVYRESRAQEIVDLLWASPESPWHKKINMLGESGIQNGPVSQSAWIKSLLATFVKSWEGKRIRIGGLFGVTFDNEQPLSWNLCEQAAFLMIAGNALFEEIKGEKPDWVKKLERENKLREIPSDIPVIWGPHSLLSQDQGIRAFLYAVNDLCYVSANQLELMKWGSRGAGAESSVEEVKAAISSLKKTKINRFLLALAKAMATYDWRASSAPSLGDEERLRKAAFRGSGGYKELRRDVLKHLSRGTGEISVAAKAATKTLGL